MQYGLDYIIAVDAGQSRSAHRAPNFLLGRSFQIAYHRAHDGSRARTGIAAQSWRDHGRWRVREFLDYQASYYRAARHGKPYSQVPGRDLAGTWPDNIGAGEN
jgi:hypothetical protein